MKKRKNRTSARVPVKIHSISRREELNRSEIPYESVRAAIDRKCSFIVCTLGLIDYNALDKYHAQLDVIIIFTFYFSCLPSVAPHFLLPAEISILSPSICRVSLTQDDRPAVHTAQFEHSHTVQRTICVIVK